MEFFFIVVIIAVSMVFFYQSGHNSSSNYTDAISSNCNQKRCRALDESIFFSKLTCITKWNTSVYIHLYKDCLEINNEEEIPWNKIVNVTIETESQIQKDVSASKLLAFGALALATKKTKTVTERFLVVTYINDFKKEEKLIFRQDRNDFSIEEAKNEIIKGYKRFKPICY